MTITYCVFRGDTSFHLTASQMGQEAHGGLGISDNTVKRTDNRACG